MRFSDTAAGLIVTALGLGVAGYARTFPPMPGQDIGPSFFPVIIGVGLVVFGLTLAFSGQRQAGSAHVAFDEWVRRPRAARNAALVAGMLAFYVTSADALGFLPAAAVLLVVLWLALGARGRWLAPLALGIALFVHYAFYTVLGVPLPWGLLDPIAW
jgi:putative tricarboxylic transport membrane protein